MRDNSREEISSEEEIDASMRLAGRVVLIAWIVAGLLLSWLCSWVWSDSFWIAGAIYFVVSVIAAIIIGRAKLSQDSDA